jgi:hypothetical protein
VDGKAHGSTNGVLGNGRENGRRRRRYGAKDTMLLVRRMINWRLVVGRSGGMAKANYKWINGR